jgi:putative effector of murein hydrolase
VLLMPIIATPMVLITLALLTHVSYPQYYAQTHWLVWLLGPTTVAFALPLYENRKLLRKHWMSIATGVVVASLVSISTSVRLPSGSACPKSWKKAWPCAASPRRLPSRPRKCWAAPPIWRRCLCC